MNWPELLCPERLRPTTKQPEELRTEIERDYGRVVFSTPVRRLQDKAQVFPLEPIDAVRTRLTHSMEVSSVARSLARSVARALIERPKTDVNEERAYHIESIAAICGLIHDIGNPAFGHAGEQAIQDWFKARPAILEAEERLRKDFEQFEGNAHTLRLLSKLQLLSDRSGLNLTCATLSAACKYTANASEVGMEGRHSKSKLGYFASEEDVVQRVRERTGTGDGRNPISFLVEASDDMVYSVVDIEDGIKKGVVSWDEVRSILFESRQSIGEKMFADTVEKAEKRIADADIRLPGRSKDEAIGQFFRTLAIGKAHEAVQRAFLHHYEAIMDGAFDRELLYESDAAGLYDALKKKVGRQRVYNSKETLRLEVLGRTVLTDLLDLFWAAERSDKTKSFPQKIYNLLSGNYRTVFESPTEFEKNLPETYRKALLITDYICGMTDTFALNLHREIRNG